ncbi:Helitron_like_N domain-containing protein [Raphanus sativus]|nr:Helitron_like_N domain-containing protein [Raphanus sativus]
MQDNYTTPNSIFKKTLNNQTIPLTGAFGRILKDISNLPQSGGIGSQIVQSPPISSSRFGTLSQTPYVASTSMGYCRSHGLKGLQGPSPTTNNYGSNEFRGDMSSSSRNTLRSKFDSTVIEPKQLFETDDVNSQEEVAERHYNQEYDLSSEDSGSSSALSTYSEYLFRDVDSEKFDFQSIVNKIKARDAKREANKLNRPLDASLKTIPYIDEGNPTFKCEYCKAKMWYGERIDRKTRTKKNPIFSLCCGQGQVKLPMLRESPLVIKELLYGKDEKSRYYQKNLRALNMLFSFTSLGGKVDRSSPNGVGPKTFTLQGENYHLMGSMKPDEGDSAKFSQLYIVDIETEVDDRDSIMSKYNTESDKSKKQALRKHIIEDIIKVLDDVNPYVKKFRQARERLSMEPNEKFHMRIVSNREKDGRTYDTPISSEVAALIPGDFNMEMDRRDIVLQEKQTGWLKRISEIHPSYLALH